MSIGSHQHLDNISLCRVAITKSHKLGILTEVYYLIILDTRSPRSRCQQDWFLLRAMRKNLSHASPLVSDALLAISGLPGHVEASPQSLSFMLFSVCVCVCVHSFI